MKNLIIGVIFLIVGVSTYTIVEGKKDIVSDKSENTKTALIPNKKVSSVKLDSKTKKSNKKTAIKKSIAQKSTAQKSTLQDSKSKKAVKVTSKTKKMKVKPTIEKTENDLDMDIVKSAINPSKKLEDRNVFLAEINGDSAGLSGRDGIQGELVHFNSGFTEYKDELINEDDAFDEVNLFKEDE